MQGDSGDLLQDFGNLGEEIDIGDIFNVGFGMFYTLIPSSM